MKRGCGTRVKGGVYAETEFDPTGRGTPFHLCVIDPPIEVRLVNAEDLEGLASLEEDAPVPMKARGVSLWPRTDPETGEEVWHIYDWVGAGHYPNVADFIEEATRYGVSRRLPSTLPFERITPRSRLFLGHARAIIENPNDYYQHVLDRPEGPELSCPRKREAHEHDSLREQAVAVGQADFCGALWWEDVEGVAPSVLYPFPRDGQRTVGDTTYRARSRPESVKPVYKPGLFLSVPIAHLTVIKDPEGGADIDNLVKASAAKVGVRWEEE